MYYKLLNTKIYNIRTNCTILVKRDIRVLELASIYHMFLRRVWFNIPLNLEGIFLLCPVWYRIMCLNVYCINLRVREVCV